MSRGQFDQKKKVVKVKAFMPRTGKLDISLYGTRGMTDVEILQIAEQNILPRVRELFGRASVKAASFEKPLRLDPDNEPEHHVNVLGWPEDEEHQLELATAIALYAELILLPKPIRGEGGAVDKKAPHD